MPLRPFNREQGFLLPPSLDELVPADHQARFVDALLEGLGEEEWVELGVELEGDPHGAPAYHPRALLGVWIYGFMSGTRSTRKLERACREQLPYAWLTGLQYPDHNTLWRFYKEHRQQMRRLLPFTVRMAVEMNLVDFALQAVDGSKVQASAAKERTLDEEGLERLLRRVEEEIEELERQNGALNEAQEPRLPGELAKKEALLNRAQEGLERIRVSGDKRTNLTDSDASLMKGRSGFITGYNAQAVVSPLADRRQPEGGPPERSMLTTAAEVSTSPEDQPQLAPMIRAAAESTGDACAITLADGGYHSGANLERVWRDGRVVLMPEAARPNEAWPYDKTCFEYRPEDNTFVCPEGQTLSFRGIVRRSGRPEAGRWRAEGRVCRACTAFGACTTNRNGRTVETGPYEGLLAGHRKLMQQEWARELYKQRKELVEPVFGIIKEQQSGRRFLLRGLENVRAEWSLLASAFNLKMLWGIWRERTAPLPSRLRRTLRSLAPLTTHAPEHCRPHNMAA